jgi:hypothetical protein
MATANGAMSRTRGDRQQLDGGRVGVGAAMAATDVAGVCSIDRSSVAVFMVTPFVGLQCKYPITYIVSVSRTAPEGDGMTDGGPIVPWPRARVPTGGDGCSVQVESRALSRPSRIRSSPNANSSP